VSTEVAISRPYWPVLCAQPHSLRKLSSIEKLLPDSTTKKNSAAAVSPFVMFAESLIIKLPVDVTVIPL